VKEHDARTQGSKESRELKSQGRRLRQRTALNAWTIASGIERDDRKTFAEGLKQFRSDQNQKYMSQPNQKSHENPPSHNQQ
jgi:hypothetical protein